MAEFTDQLGGPSPASAPIPTAVEQPDYLGTIAKFGNAVGGLLQDRADERSRQKIAQADALNDQALDTFAGRVFDVMSNRGMARIVNDVANTKAAVDAGAVSSSRLDLELERAISRTMREFPDSKFEIFNKMSELGVDHYVFRQARMEQEQFNTLLEAQSARTKTYLEAFTNSGIDPSLFPTDQDQLSMGRKIVKGQNDLAQRKAAVEVDLQELDLTTQQGEAEFKVTSNNARESYIDNAAVYTEPMFRNIIDLIETAPSDADLASFIGEDSGRIIGQFDAFRLQMMNDVRASGLLSEDITQIEAFFDENRAALVDLFSGEMGVAKSRARALQLIKDNQAIAARNALPTLFLFKDAGIQTGMEDFLTISGGSALRDAAATELHSFLNRENTDEARAGQQTFEILSEMRGTGRLPEGADIESVTKAVRMDAPVHKKNTDLIASGQMNSLVELTDYANQTASLSEYASKMPALEMSERDAASIVSSFGSPQAREAMMSARNIDDRRGVLAMRMSAAGVLNGYLGLKQKVIERNKLLGRQFGLAQEDIKFNAETGRWVYDQPVGESLDRSARDIVTHLNMAVDHLHFIEQEVGIGFPENLPFESDVDKINYLTSGVTPENVINYVNNQTPIVEKSRATWGDARATFNQELLAKAPPQSQEGQFFGSIFERIDAVENGGTADYNTLYQFANTSEFSDVKVSEMTLAELDEFEERYGPWVEERNNGTLATPMGRFQIVGTTRRRVAKALGIPENTVFTPDVQDAMAKFLIAEAFNNGTPLEDIWVGLKND